MNCFINPASTWKLLFQQSSFYLRKVIYIFLRGEKSGGKCPGDKIFNVLDPRHVYMVESRSGRLRVSLSKFFANNALHCNCISAAESWAWHVRGRRAISKITCIVMYCIKHVIVKLSPMCTTFHCYLNSYMFKRSFLYIRYTCMHLFIIYIGLHTYIIARYCLFSLESPSTFSSCLSPIIQSVYVLITS